MLRTFDRLRSVDLGVRTSHVLTFAVHLPMGRYGDAEQRARFHRDFQARLAALPGVRAAAAISRLPVTGTYHSWGARRADLPRETRFTQSQQRVVEGPYFKAVGIPLLRGRTFGPEDDAKAPRRVVISQELARQLFPSDDPIGKRLRVAGRATRDHRRGRRCGARSAGGGCGPMCITPIRSSPVIATGR